MTCCSYRCNLGVSVNLIVLFRLAASVLAYRLSLHVLKDRLGWAANFLLVAGWLRLWGGFRRSGTWLRDLLLLLLWGEANAVARRWRRGHVIFKLLESQTSSLKHSFQAWICIYSYSDEGLCASKLLPEVLCLISSGWPKL